MSINCEFCNKIFTTKSILKTHQKTAKFCLNLRKCESTEWKCEFCNKTFTTKNSLGIHHQTCKKKIDYEYQTMLKMEKENIIKIFEKRIEDKDELINKLQDQIKELAKSAIEKPNNLNTFNTVNQDQRQTNNNNNNNQNNIKNIDNRTINMIPFNLTPESFRETLENKFNETHLLKGQKGIAEFMLENVLITGEKDAKKYLLKCTDPSRRVFISLDGEGKIIKDVNADNLTRMISGPVKEVSHKIYQQIQDRYFQVYENTSNELEEDDEESKTLNLENERLDYATTKVVEISKLKNNNTEFVKGLIPPLSI